jgi:hypothetical protein
MAQPAQSANAQPSKLFKLLESVPGIVNPQEIEEKLHSFKIYTLEDLNGVEAVDIVGVTGLDVSTCSQLIEASRNWSSPPQENQKKEIKFTGNVAGIFTLGRTGPPANQWVKRKVDPNRFRSPAAQALSSDDNNNSIEGNNPNVNDNSVVQSIANNIPPAQSTSQSSTQSATVSLHVPLLKLEVGFVRIVSVSKSHGVPWAYQIIVNDFVSNKHTVKITLQQLHELHSYLTAKYPRFPFEPFPAVSPSSEINRTELEKHKASFQKYFDTVTKNVEIINDPKFRELFLLKQPQLSASQDLAKALAEMCSQMASTENTMFTLFETQINDVVLETNPHLVQSQNQLKADVSEYSDITIATINYTVTYRVFLNHCMELLKIASNALKDHDRQGFRTPIVRMIDEARKSHQSAVTLVEQLQQFVIKVKSHLEDIKSQKTTLTHKKNALLIGGISVIALSSILSVPLLLVTAPRATIRYGLNKPVDVPDFFPLVKLATQILKKGGFDQMKEALKKFSDLIDVYEGALEKIKQQQSYFVNLQSALSEVNAKCSDLDILKEDDLEFLKMEFPLKFNEVQSKLRGLYNSVEGYLCFLKDKGLIDQIPEVPPFRLT